MRLFICRFHRFSNFKIEQIKTNRLNLPDTSPKPHKNQFVSGAYKRPPERKKTVKTNVQRKLAENKQKQTAA